MGLILGLDISTKCGVALVDERGVHSATQFEFKKETGLERAGCIAHAVLNVALRHKEELDMIVIEGFGYANSNSLVTLVEIATVVKYFLMQEGFKLLIVPPTSVKKHLTGKGVSPKGMMLLEVFKQYGYSASTDNIADAVALGMFGLNCLGRGKFNAVSTACCKEVLKKQSVI